MGRKRTMDGFVTRILFGSIFCFSIEVLFAVAQVPPTPTDVKLSYSTPKDSSLSVSWTMPSVAFSITGFNISLTSSRSENITRTFLTSEVKTSYQHQVNDLVSGERYWARVVALHLELASVPSEVSNFDTTYTPAIKNSSLTLLQPELKNFGLVVHWTMPHTNFLIKSFSLRVRAKTTVTTSHIVYYTNEVKYNYNYTINNLVPGESYGVEFQVNSKFIGVSSAGSKKTVRLALPGPGNVSLTNPTVGSDEVRLDISWEMPTSIFIISSFDITLYSTKHGTTHRTMNTSCAQTRYTWTLDGLVYGEIYSVAVRAISYDAQSPISEKSSPERLYIDKCSFNPCENNASCVNYLIDYSCDCAPGFTGRHCSKDINECEPSPCENGGLCTDLVNDYNCSCFEGFSGKNCSTDITSTTDSISFQNVISDITATTDSISFQNFISAESNRIISIVVGIGSGSTVVILVACFFLWCTLKKRGSSSTPRKESVTNLPDKCEPYYVTPMYSN